MFEVRKEKVLLLDCLGPPESDWNMQSFQVCSDNFNCLHLKNFWISSSSCFGHLLQVNRYGCVGGRRHNPDDARNNRETVLFRDITVSRRHFEVIPDMLALSNCSFSHFFLSHSLIVFLRDINVDYLVK
jgi:hypothetical protein